MRISSFKPVALEKALLLVRSQHRLPANIEFLEHSDLLEEVRRKLLEIDDRNIPDAARSFSPLELTVILHLLCLPEDDKVLRTGERVVLQRPRSDYLTYGWMLIRNHYPVSLLEEILVEIGPKFEWRPLAKNTAEKNRYERWFGRGSLLQNITDDFLIHETGNEIDDWLQSVGIPKRSNLNRGIWKYILTRSGKELIDRMGHTQLLEKVKEQVNVIQNAFALKYLKMLEKRSRWNVDVLEWIRDKFGVPSKRETDLTHFWRKIPEKVRKAFRRWANERVLRGFFEKIRDPHGRFAFWSQYMSQIDSVIEVRLPDGDAALIDFGDFGVVEFSNIGNAAYVYPSQFMAILESKVANRVVVSTYTLKNISRTIKGPVTKPLSDGRIIHSAQWQRKYKPQIDSLLHRHRYHVGY